MILASDGRVILDGIEPLICAEFCGIVNSVHKKLVEVHGEELANEQMVFLGQLALAESDEERNALTEESLERCSKIVDRD
jgi:hypothetical protein